MSWFVHVAHRPNHSPQINIFVPSSMSPDFSHHGLPPFSRASRLSCCPCLLFLYIPVTLLHPLCLAIPLPFSPRNVCMWNETFLNSIHRFQKSEIIIHSYIQLKKDYQVSILSHARTYFLPLFFSFTSYFSLFLGSSFLVFICYCFLVTECSVLPFLLIEIPCVSEIIETNSEALAVKTKASAPSSIAFLHLVTALSFYFVFLL